MKNILLLVATIFLSSFSNAQLKVTDLPVFYNNIDGNHIRSVDLIAGEEAPIVIYTTYLRPGVHCKKWNGSNWVTFGEFPEIKDRGFVDIENNNGYKALVQAGNIWSVYELDEKAMKWNKVSSIDFKEESLLSEPTLTFNNGNPVIYEQHYRTKELHIFSQKGTEIKALNLDGKDRIDSYFKYFYSDKNNESVMAWINNKDVLEIFFVDSEGESKKSIKGFKKKDVKEIVELKEHNGKYFLFWLDKSWDLRCSEYFPALSKWVEVVNQEKLGMISYNVANDNSLISVSRESELCVYNKYNGKSWEKGEILGTEKTEKNKMLKLIKIKGTNYYLSSDLDGNCVIRKY